MSADLCFRNVTIVDGTGAAPVKGDVAVENGMICAVGAFEGQAKQEVDGAGRVLCPGFIDVHTHYDVQLLWDAAASPSLVNGVTTVVTGNCSLSMAPVRPQHRGMVMNLFDLIEDIPADVLGSSFDWSWETFEDYLNRLRGKLAIHVAPLVGHTAIRMYVMGDDAWERLATADELSQMQEVVRAAMKAGAVGVSDSQLDVDQDLRPVPCRVGDGHERLALCQAMAESGHGVWQDAPYWPDPARQLRDIAELGRLSRETGCTSSWAMLFQHDAAPHAWKDCLQALEREAATGAKVIAQVPVRPIDLTFRLDGGSMLLLALPGWMKLMQLPLPLRTERFASKVRRRQLVAEGAKLNGVWRNAIIQRTFTDATHPYQGRRLEEVAAERGVPLAAALIDLAVADNLQTVFYLPRLGNGNQEVVNEILQHPCVMAGGSDAGAHLSQFCGAGDAVFMLEDLVLRKKTMSMEHAVHQLTGRAADVWGIANRGVVAPGKHADLVLLDPQTLACGPEEDVADLPGGGRRLVRHPKGVDMVVVGGQVAVKDGVPTSAHSGQVVELVTRPPRGAAPDSSAASEALVAVSKPSRHRATDQPAAMRYHLLGRSGLRVSEVCLGTMTFGTQWGFGADARESARMWERFVAAGGNFIDTANQYSGGGSEEIIAGLLTGVRERMVLATKFTMTMDPTDPNAAGNHRKNLVQSLEASLRRLQTDYVDLLYVHAWDFTVAPDEVMRALQDVVHSGKVLHVGVSDTPAWVVARANTLAELRGWSPFVSLQVEYSLSERTPERDLIPMARELGLTVAAWGPLGGGMLTGKYNRDAPAAWDLAGSKRAPVMRHFATPFKQRIATEVMAVAQKLERPPAAVAVNWLRQQPGILPIVGARTDAQLEESLQALQFALDPEDLQRLDEVSAVSMGFPGEFLNAPWVRSSIWGQLEDRIDKHRLPRGGR